MSQEKLETKRAAEAASEMLYRARGTPECVAMLTLVRYELDRTKELLVDASPQEVPQLQGKAQTYLFLIDRLTRSNASAMKPKEISA